MEEIEDKTYPTRLQNKIEYIVTKGVGFRDTPKNFPVEQQAENLLELRMYLSAMEANVSLNTRNLRNSDTASRYLGHLWSISSEQFYSKKFDLNTSEGIDDALKDRAEKIWKVLNTPLEAVV